MEVIRSISNKYDIDEYTIENDLRCFIRQTNDQA
jgi:hypothetical protein